MSGNKVVLRIIIPTYNEAENIVELLSRIDKSLSSIENLDYKVFVIDDNSPDGTAEIARNYGEEHGTVKVFVRERKEGLGSAILYGIRKALEDPTVTHIMTMDADLSHRPEDMPEMIKETSVADLVQGSRYIEGGKIIGWGLHRHIISKIANFLVRTIYKTGLREHTTNYRIYSRRSAELVSRYSTMKSYEWVIEALLINIACGMKVVESPIIFVNRKKGKSKLAIGDMYRWWKFIVSYRKRFKEVRESCKEVA